MAKRSTEYKVRVCKNWKIDTQEDCYGIAIMIPGSTKYCKYCINHNDYSTREEAEKTKIQIEELLKKGGRITYGNPDKPSTGINKSEYIKIV